MKEEDIKTFTSGFGRHSMKDFLKLDIRELRSSAIYPKRRLEVINRNTVILKELCSHFSVVDEIGYCEYRKVICPIVDCEYLARCQKDCIDSCLLRHKSTEVYSKTPKEVKKAVKLLRTEIRTLIKAHDQEVVYGYLVHRLEKLLPLALTKEPEELVFILTTRIMLYDLFGDLRKFRIPENPPESTRLSKLWNHLVTQFVLAREFIPLEAGDSVLFVTPEGKKLFRKLEKNPNHLASHFVQRSMVLESRPKDYKSKAGYLYKFAWTSKMLPAMLWCNLNDFQPHLGSFDLTSEYSTIVKHIEEVGSSGELKPAECLELGLPFYTKTYHTLRFFGIRKDVDWFRKVILHYRRNSKLLDFFQRIGITFQPWLWDNTVFSIGLPENNPMRLSPKDIINAKDCSEISEAVQSKIWPLSDGNHVLYWSAFLLGFAVRKVEEFVTDPRAAGKWFEKTIEDEITERRLPILQRNKDLPRRLGDIDILTMHSSLYYLIEAKEWGPRSSRGYFASESYERRHNELAKEIRKTEKRLRWSNHNKSELGLPDNAPIRGLFVTAFREPHLKSTKDVEVIPHQHLCSVLGGTPMNPILALSRMSFKVDFGRKITEPMEEQVNEKEKESKTQEMTVLMTLVGKKITERFGSIDAYHLYRHIAELESAIEKEGFSVKELMAEPLMRPGNLTIDYVLFSFYRIDIQSRSRFDAALKLLEDNGFVSIDDGRITLTNEVDVELWKKDANQLVAAKDESESHVILYKNAELGKEESGRIFAVFPPFIRTTLDDDFVITDIWTR